MLLFIITTTAFMWWTFSELEKVRGKGKLFSSRFSKREEATYQFRNDLSLYSVVAAVIAVIAVGVSSWLFATTLGDFLPTERYGQEVVELIPFDSDTVIAVQREGVNNIIYFKTAPDGKMNRLRFSQYVSIQEEKGREHGRLVIYNERLKHDWWWLFAMKWFGYHYHFNIPRGSIAWNEVSL